MVNPEKETIDFESNVKNALMFYSIEKIRRMNEKDFDQYMKKYPKIEEFIKNIATGD
jgi:hypothetical protein